MFSLPCLWLPIYPVGTAPAHKGSDAALMSKNPGNTHDYKLFHITTRVKISTYQSDGFTALARVMDH